MTSDRLLHPSTPFGRRAEDRLQSEKLIWLTLVGPSGTPQPNPVWFLWTGSDVVIYNAHDALRVAWLHDRPLVSLNLDSRNDGDDVVILTGRASVDPELPAPHESTDYLAKYDDAMINVSGSLAAFGARYSVGARIAITRIRGF